MTNVALYMRISVNEPDKSESNSISNQRNLLHHFLDSHTELATDSRVEYVDDGFSGTTLHRPALERLLDDIKKGIVSCVLVKDLSRFMRNYLELGNFLENIFPFMGVRFIAVNDDYDSKHHQSNSTDLDLQFKSLFNEYYARDVSEKVKSSMNVLKRSGKMLACFTPFGYLKSEENPYQIVIDERVSPIVKKIFQLYLEGFGYAKIAQFLNSKNMTTPAQRKMELCLITYSRNVTMTEKQKKNAWTRDSVRYILTNEAYKGTYLFNKWSGGKFSPRKRQESEWERIEGHHEAIISPSQFEEVQKLIASKRVQKSRNQICKKTPLIGHVYCEHCDHKLIFKNCRNRNFYFRCEYCHVQNYEEKFCRVSDIEEDIRNHLIVRNDSSVQNQDNQTLCIKDLEKEKFSAFERYKGGQISKEDFVKIKNDISEKIHSIELGEKSHKNHSSNHTMEELVSQFVDRVIVNHQGVFTVIYK